MSIIDVLEKARLIPVIVINDINDAVPLATALVKGGFPVLEVTFRTAVAAEAIALITKEVPGAIVGAGTILTQEQLIAAQEAGAFFGVSPGFDLDLIKLSQTRNWNFIPGVATATELIYALKYGCRMLKFFPAEAAGGVKMLSSLLAAFRHTGVKFMPTGGVNEMNAKQYLAINEVVAVGSSWIADSALIKAKNWGEIESRALKTSLNLLETS